MTVLRNTLDMSNLKPIFNPYRIKPVCVYQTTNHTRDIILNVLQHSQASFIKLHPLTITLLDTTTTTTR